MAAYRKTTTRSTASTRPCSAPAKGDPLVYIHGGGTATGFDALLPLADSRRLIVPHHPGFGASADDSSIDSAQDYVLHYLDLFDALGLDDDGSRRPFVRRADRLQPGDRAASPRPSARARGPVRAAHSGLIRPSTSSTFPPEEVLGYLTADMSVFDDLLPPTPEFLAERGREAESFARVSGKRADDPKAGEVAAPADDADAPALGRRRQAHSRGAGPGLGGKDPRHTDIILPGVGHLLFDESRGRGRRRRRASSLAKRLGSPCRARSGRAAPCRSGRS